MKRAIVLALMALVLPTAVRASGIDIGFGFGSVSISTGGIVSRGVQLQQYGGIVAPHGHSLGSVMFSTGPCLSGCRTLFQGDRATFAGGIFELIGKGKSVSRRA